MFLRKRQDNITRECGVNSSWIVWGSRTSKHCVETGHQAKMWATDFKNSEYFMTSRIRNYTNQIKIIKSHTTVHKWIAPGIRLLLFLPPSPLWSNFLALRTVFRIDWKCCCQSPIPFGAREGTKPPTTPLLLQGPDCLFLSWPWIMTDCNIRCYTEVLLTASKDDHCLLTLSDFSLY